MSEDKKNLDELFELNEQLNFPVESSQNKIVVSGQNNLTVIDPLQAYLRDIAKYQLLTPQEELELTKELWETGDIEIAKKLVLANLRLVVKIAMEYRHSYQNVIDLIQEGNVGLMKAVSKYNPEMGAKLSYYASWWIKSYILKFILDNFRLIKIGTTNDQKKIFYNLMKEKQNLEQQGIEPTSKRISERLGVSEADVIEMDTRLNYGGESSLDRPIDAEGHILLSDQVADTSQNIEEQVSHSQSLEILEEHLQGFISSLKERDRIIFEERLLSEVPPSLQAIADRYGVSRERIRQVEQRLLEKLKVYMSDHIR